MSPKVTVLMPVFNSESFLNESIDSILFQTYEDFEFLIINDGSTDQSESVILSYEDSRIVYVKNNENLGLIKTLNLGLKLAKGDYIARMDADDVSHLERLSKQVQLMEKNKNIGVCGTWFQVFGEKEIVVKHPVEDEDIRIRLLSKSPFCHPSTIIRKEILYNNNISYNEDHKHAEDYGLWFNLFHCCEFYNIPEILLLYRRHPNSISLQQKKIQDCNSQKIRTDFLQTIIADFNEYVNNAHLAILSIDEEPLSDKADVVNLENLYIALIKANEQKRLFPPRALNKYLKIRFWLTCTSSSNLGPWIFSMYARSSLRLSRPAVLWLKFFIKCIGFYTVKPLKLK